MGRTRLRWLSLAFFILFALAPASGRGQDPVIIPGLPGRGLQSGVRPSGSLAAPHAPAHEAPTADRLETSEGPPVDLSTPKFGVSGNWFGARDAFLDRGIDLQGSASQFYQGVTSGGLRQNFQYGLKLDYFGTIEAEKLLGWEGLYVNLHGESRFGASINQNVGSMVPANFALEFPAPSGNASALTNMQIEQFWGTNFALTFGKLNAADGVNIHPFLGGNGLNRFTNEAFVLNPIYGRTIPYSTPGAGFSYLRDLDPLFTFIVLDTSGRPDTPGLSRMFRNGATLFGHLRIPVSFFDRPGHQSLEGTYATGKFSPFSPDDYIILNHPPLQQSALRQTGSWVITYGFDQFLKVDDQDPTKGWGVFTNISLADQATNPVHWFLNLGAGGTSPLPGRTEDSWGMGYYFLGTSEVLRQTLGPLAPNGHEQGFECYYNATISPGFILSADIQTIEPALLDARSAFLFGLRAKIEF